MEKSPTIALLLDALSQAQGEFEPAIKDSVNQTFNDHKYADISAILNVTQAVRAKHGLSVVQFPGRDKEGVFVETLIGHKSGEWMSGKTYVTPNDPQGDGSLITYARRYALQAALGVAAEDDDGEAAQRRKRAKTEREQQSQAPQKPSVMHAEWNAVTIKGVQEDKIDEKLWAKFTFSNDLSAYTSDPDLIKKAKALGESPCDVKAALTTGRFILLSITYIEQ